MLEEITTRLNRRRRKKTRNEELPKRKWEDGKGQRVERQGEEGYTLYDTLRLH